MNRAHARGLTLIELTIAMLLGLLLVAGALTIFVQSRSTERVNETVARLQEQGRYALSMMEPDLELAGLFGFSNEPAAVRWVRGGNPLDVRATALQMRQFPALAGDPLPATVGGLPAGAHVCGINFAVDVSMPVQGSNGVFEMGRGRTGCNPYSSGAQPGADTVTIRRTETEDSAAEAGRLQVYASRLTSRTAQFLFSDGNAPGALDADHRLYNLAVRTYYVARDSVNRAGFPALRVKSMTRSGAGIVFDEDEVMSGIEDLQVQFGVDCLADPNGRTARYVNPDFADLSRCQVSAVRVWLRVRADDPEVGFIDDRTYRYADVVYTPAGVERAFRRILISRTVAVRNARVY